MTHLAALRLVDFRSYAALDWTIEARVNVLVGPNGAGKTNLLEAISLLAPGRGLRGAKFADLARRAPDAGGGFALAGAITAQDRPAERLELTSTVGTGERERRKFFVDGQAVSSAEAASLFSAVWLTPQMDRLFTEGASARRRFLDRLTLALEPGHARQVAAFEAAAANRNRLLEQGRFDPVWCGILEDSMARHAVAMTASRLDLIARLNAAMAPRAAMAAFPPARLDLLCEIGSLLAAHPAVEVEDRLRARLASTRGPGHTPISPQRADLSIADARGASAALASTGEQRAMLVAIILFHAELVRDWRGTPPVLLLDEPFVHLDHTRQAALRDHLLGGSMHVFCTATETGLWQDQAAIWSVDAGALTRRA
ncbi:MAG: DNA replication/repair protein RecF [Acidiphilium sp.]